MATELIFSALVILVVSATMYNVAIPRRCGNRLIRATMAILCALNIFLLAVILAGLQVVSPFGTGGRLP